MTGARGLLVGALSGALLLVLGFLALDGPRALATPGPVALPHQALGCDDCHRAEALSNTCTGCHGSHESSRVAHRELAIEGRLGCAQCHAVHRSELGVRFEPGGQARLFGTGFETLVPSPFAAKLTVPVVVPFVASGACAGCHRLGDSEDPAAHCVQSREANSPTVCFDEHRRPGERHAAASAERDGAVEAARALAVRAPGVLERRGLAGNGALLGLALGVGLVASAGSAALGRLLRRRGRLGASTATLVSGAPRRLPVVDAARCLGCHACADACPYDVLEIRRYVAVVARPDACCGAGPCEERCPNGSLVLGSPRANPAPPGASSLRVRPGLYIAGDVTGGALIRSALRQGVQVAHQVHEERRCRPPEPAADVVDLLVVGAGPAGLAAALTAKRLGLSVAVLEAAAIGESIRRFSRQKLVLDAAQDPDEELPLFIADAPKEELLERWLYAVRHARLTVHQRTRVVRLEPVDADGTTRVHALFGDEGVVFSGRAVLVAVGRRGTPRRLAAAIDDDVVGRVHYELSDARAFAGKRMIVVGLGDVAMEMALALAAQPGTEVAVVHRGSGFRRGKRRNIDALGRLVARGRVEFYLSSEVARVTREGVTLSGQDRPLPFDALFVAIGSFPESASAEWFAPGPESS